VPEWIEKRKAHLMKKNPEMDESTAWGIATNQARAAGKVSKDFGTAEGRRSAKKTYKKKPAEYEQRADPPSKQASLDKLAYHQMRVSMRVHTIVSLLEQSDKLLHLRD
jgi:hypothetical protein